MSKPVYLDISKLNISKIGMITLNQSMRIEQNCYTDTDSFIIHIITKDFCEGIAGDVKKWFDTYNHEENDKRPLPIGMSKRVYD